MQRPELTFFESSSADFGLFWGGGAGHVAISVVTQILDCFGGGGAGHVAISVVTQIDVGVAIINYT